MKADILSKKEQVDTKEDNKDIQLLKEELWQRKTMAEVTVIKKKIAEENDILKEIRRNTMREKEVLQVLGKKKDGIIYMDGRIYMPNNKLHGIPRKVLSDRGPQFTLKFMKELIKLLETKKQLSTAYYPQTDSQTERINQEIGTFL